MGTTLTNEQRTAREIEVRRLLDEGSNVAEIARKLNVSRQAVKQFCVIRGWVQARDWLNKPGRPPKAPPQEPVRKDEKPRRAKKNGKSGLDNSGVAT